MANLPDIGRNPDYGLSEGSEFNLSSTDFGDGYTQVRPKGINAVRRVWEVKWSGLNKQDADTLYEFLRGTMGVERFTWTHPDNNVGVLVRCKGPKLTYDTYDGYTLTTTLREEFGL